jgi:hypothetical protein
MHDQMQKKNPICVAQQLPSGARSSEPSYNKSGQIIALTMSVWLFLGMEPLCSSSCCLVLFI